MKFLNLFRKQNEKRNRTFDDFFHETSDFNQRSSQVTVRSAMGYSPVWQAVDLITSDVSRIPWITYRRVSTDAGEGKEKARNHAAFRILRRNVGAMTTNLWIVRILSHALLHGNGFSRIHRDNRNRLVALEWLPAEDVTIVVENGVRAYIHSPPDGVEQRITADKMFHLEGLTIGAAGGASVIEYAADTIRQQLAANDYGAEFFTNGATPQGFLSHPHTLPDSARRNFLRAWEDRHRGKGNRHKVALLEEGITWQSMAVSPEDAQLLEVAAWGVKEVARFFNLPPGKLGDSDRTSYSSVEQENRSYYNSSLGRWFSRLESEANDKLFTSSEQRLDSHFCEFKVDALFKADTATRFAAASTAISFGIKSPNEVRAEENLNPYPGGEKFLHPLNMASPEDIATGGEEGTEAEELPAAAAGSATISESAARDVLRDTFERAIRRVVSAATKAARRPEKYIESVSRISEDHAPAIVAMLSPAIRLYRLDDAEKISTQFLSDCVGEFIDASDCAASELPSQVGLAAERIRSQYTKKIELIGGGN